MSSEAYRAIRDVITARRFHEMYEALAPDFGWQTQERSRVSWDKLPDNQRELMVAVVRTLRLRGAFTYPDGDA